MSCCTNTYKNNRPVYTCSDSFFKLPYSGLVPGAAYTFRTNFLGVVLEFVMIADDDGKVTMPTESLNEHYQYVGSLYDVDENKMLFTIQSKSILTDSEGNILTDPEGNILTTDNISKIYDCISFETRLVSVKIVQTILKPQVILTDPEGNIITDPEGNILSAATNI